MLLLFRRGAEQLCITRVETGRSAEVVLGGCELILPQEPLAEVEVGIRVVWIERCRPFQMFSGSLESAQAEQREAEIVVDDRIVFKGQPESKDRSIRPGLFNSQITTMLAA